MDKLLKADDVRELLDKNDEILKILGKQHQGVVPSVVVVGAQSHGKSSVLEMISGIKLPAGAGMVTKRPLVIQLRNSAADIQPVVRFQPREGEAQVIIMQNNVSEKVSAETARSNAEQHAAGNPTGVVDLPMTLRIEAANLPDVTLIDLPGIKYDDPEAEARIKSLIKQWIDPETSIILVVHNAAVDTGTNEGFKLAKLADPLGKRMLCVLTHVDVVKDAQLLQERVIAPLTQIGTKYIAMCCPPTSKHDSISHAAALQDERLFFALHAHLRTDSTALRGRTDCTGTDAVVRLITRKYKAAVIAAQAPMQQELFKLRAEAARALAVLPPPQSALARFTHMWAAMVAESEHLLRGSSADHHPKRTVYEACIALSSQLMKVPKTLVARRSEEGEDGVAALVKVVLKVTGTTLPNFTPWEPLEDFGSRLMRKHYVRAVKRVLKRVREVRDALCAFSVTPATDASAKKVQLCSLWIAVTASLRCPEECDYAACWLIP